MNLNRGEKNRASECIVAIHRKGLGRDAIRYIIAKLAKSPDEPFVRTRGEKHRASECLVMIGRYGFSKDAVEYIITELTKSVEGPKEEEGTYDEE